MAGRNAGFQGLAYEWARAELEADTDFLAGVLADDFVAIGPSGYMLTKEQWLKRHTTGKLTYKSMNLDEVAVRSYGDAAVLTGHQRSSTVYEDDEHRYESDDEFGITVVFSKIGGDTSIVGLHLSPISGPPS